MKGTEEVNELFSSDKIFSYPKPTKLIERLIQIGSNSKDIVLDFFLVRQLQLMLLWI